MKRLTAHQKAQLQMGETIFAVIIILLLIVFGLVFFKETQKDELTQKKAAFLDLDSVAVAQYMSSLSEIQCSILEVKELSCFDIEKMNAFKKLRTNYPLLTSEYYFSKLGNAYVYVDEIYPQEKTFVIYNNTLSDDINHNEQFIIIPVSLFDPITKTYSFGTLYMRVYTRT